MTSPKLSTADGGFLERTFKLKAHGTDVRTELLAGVTTFMTMAYIIIVNPSILGVTGMDTGAVMVATILGSVVGTLLMAFLANYPFALAPGMGLNAFFAYTVVLGMGISWQVALAAVFIDGVIFLILSILPVRKRIVNDIPMTLKLAVSVGIGLFIAFIGLQSAGVIVENPATLVGLGSMTSPNVLLFVFGLVIMGILIAYNIKGSLLLGILITTIISMLFGLSPRPMGIADIVGSPPSLAPTFMQMDFRGIFDVGLIAVIFTFTFVDMFDTAGTLIGVSTKAGFLDEKGELPRADQALLADSIGTVAGAIFGTSTVTTYVESASGVADGGRTGLTAVTVALLFLLSLFFAPLVSLIPAAATAPALVIVGIYMMEPVVKIDFTDFTEAIPAFLTIAMMPFAYSIAEGLVWGILGYVFIKLFAGRAKEISATMWVLAVLFIIRFIA
ncbi:MAG: NCS2 family permease [Firmicutes bacterium]|jgi:AGZA family xanthine/uracil permease-like MFS transporter|nr:NCS2 family permease [Bacillota bacterium]